MKMVVVKEKLDFMDGNMAAAEAVRLCKPKVIVAYPITPQSPITEKLSEFVADGDIDAQYIEIDGEHSCLAAIRGAATMGVRVFTATCGPGLMYAHENLENVHLTRLPVVIAVPNRSHTSLYPDFSDSICESTTGWIQIFCESPQEVLDTLIQAYKIAENWDVLMPTMVLFDGYVTSHTGAPIYIPSQEDVDEFLPAYKRAPHLSTLDAPIFAERRGSIPMMEMEHELAMQNALEVIKNVHDEFAKKFGRGYGNGLVEKYLVDDADSVLVTISSMTGTARKVIDDLRKEGKKIGLLKLKSFRPFPAKELIDVAKNVKALGICERQETHGSNCGEIYKEIRSVIYDLDKRPKTINFALGLGGVDVTIPHLRYAAEKTIEAAETGKVAKSLIWSPEIEEAIKAKGA